MPKCATQYTDFETRCFVLIVSSWRRCTHLWELGPHWGKNAILVQSALLWISQPDFQNQSMRDSARVPGLPRDCAGLLGKLEQIDTGSYHGKRARCDRLNILWAFVFGFRTALICALCHHALGAHFPTTRIAAISRFLFNFFSRVAPQFFCQHDSPSNLVESRYPRLGQISWRIVLKQNWGAVQTRKSRYNCKVNVGGDWAHRNWTRDTN